MIVLLAIAEHLVDSCFALLPYRKPEGSDIEKAKLIAHRGAHSNDTGIFENTMEAFHLARDVGCWGIELDIHVTADRVVVVNHDATLKRLWGHDVAIADLNYQALRRLEPRIPSLAEVIAEFQKDMHLFIELKAPFKDEEALALCLEGLSPAQDYHLLTLDSSIFSQMKQIPKSALVLVALHNNVSQFCELSLKQHYGGVTGNYLLLTDKKLRPLREAQQGYGVGFVNSKRSLHRELGREIYWLFTNKAVAMAEYLKQLRLGLH